LENTISSGCVRQADRHGWDERSWQMLRAAAERGVPRITELLESAFDLVSACAEDRPPAILQDASAVVPLNAERRLGDRILAALELALDQNDLVVAEQLEQSFEMVMTRFGGPDAIEGREVPVGMLRAYERMADLRRRRSLA
ncbi:MAG: hypothetical protein WCF85_07825, partial [Rhodospirillaceae bacterium]